MSFCSSNSKTAVQTIFSFKHETVKKINWISMLLHTKKICFFFVFVFLWYNGTIVHCWKIYIETQNCSLHLHSPHILSQVSSLFIHKPFYKTIIIIIIFWHSLLSEDYGSVLEEKVKEYYVWSISHHTSFFKAYIPKHNGTLLFWLLKSFWGLKGPKKNIIVNDWLSLKRR